jgi:hypothetical protein
MRVSRIGVEDGLMRLRGWSPKPARVEAAAAGALEEQRTTADEENEELGSCCAPQWLVSDAEGVVLMDGSIADDQKEDLRGRSGLSTIGERLGLLQSFVRVLYLVFSQFRSFVCIRRFNACMNVHVQWVCLYSC